MEATISWRQRAACWNLFPAVDLVTPGPQDREEAEKLCGSCSVFRECLETILKTPIVARAGISGSRDFGHPAAGKRRDARFGTPLGVCRHGPGRKRIPTCEACWRNRLDLCRGCGHEWKQTGFLVRAEREGRCWPCWRVKKREDTARNRALAKARC